MPRSGSANGGVIGAVNNTSFGKCTQTAVTASGCLTLQPGTNIVKTAVIAGGGGGGGGGGCGNQPAGTRTGGNGGTGIVILRAPGSTSISAAPGTNTIATLPAPAGGCKVATFTVTGTLTIS